MERGETIMKQVEIKETENGYLVTIQSPAVQYYVYKYIEEERMLEAVAKYLFNTKYNVKKS